MWECSRDSNLSPRSDWDISDTLGKKEVWKKVRVQDILAFWDGQCDRLDERGYIKQQRATQHQQVGFMWNNAPGYRITEMKPHSSFSVYSWRALSSPIGQHQEHVAVVREDKKTWGVPNSASVVFHYDRLRKNQNLLSHVCWVGTGWWYRAVAALADFKTASKDETGSVFLLDDPRWHIQMNERGSFFHAGLLNVVLQGLLGPPLPAYFGPVLLNHQPNQISDFRSGSVQKLQHVFYLCVVCWVCACMLPAGGPGEAGPVVDGGNGFVHQRIRLDKREHLVWELNRRLVVCSRTVTCTRTRPGAENKKKSFRISSCWNAVNS